MNSLTATHHNLNFNLIPSDQFSQLIYWLAEDTGEYRDIDYYEGSGDKGRDVIGTTHDEDLDYFQCKRYQKITYSDLKIEIDKIRDHIKAGNIKRPRRIYFALSSSASPDAKDKVKAYCKSLDLPEPDFWGPVILDKKIKNNPEALKNFFNIPEKTESFPQIDVDGLIATGTHSTNFTIINTGDVQAVECSWRLKGFAWPGYPGTPKNFALAPREKKDLKIAMKHDFMGKNPIRELRLYFKYRDGKGNWFYSERLLNTQLVKSQAFYGIHPEPSHYIPAKPIPMFNIKSVDPQTPTGLNPTCLVTYEYKNTTKHLEIQVSATIQMGIWKFNKDEFIYVCKELAEKKITQMIASGKFENKLIINNYLKPTQETGFEAYKELRDSIC